jgi:hypothetical protein
VNEPSEQAREMLSRYRDAIGPSAGERAALVVGVQRAIESGVGPSVVVTAGAVARRTPWLAIVGVATVVAGAAWWATRVPEAEVSVVASAIEPAVVVIDEAEPSIAATTPAMPPPGDPIAKPPPPVQAPPSAAPERTAVRRTPRSAPTSTTEVAAVATPAPAVATVDAEVALLRKASVALKRGETATARARYEEHVRLFPAGALVELREVGLALLDCDRADRFAARFPDSPHLARIERECAR